MSNYPEDNPVRYRWEKLEGGRSTTKLRKEMENSHYRGNHIRNRLNMLKSRSTENEDKIQSKAGFQHIRNLVQQEEKKAQDIPKMQ